MPGDFPCSSCSPGTVSLEDTEALRQELGFALVCARRFEEAIGVLGQVAPGGLGPWGPLGPLGLGCGGPRHEENHGEFGGDSKVSRKLKDLKGKSWRIDLLEILMRSCKISLAKSPAKVGGWEVGGWAGDGFDGFVQKGDYNTYIYTYINLNGEHDFRKSLNLASPIFLKNQGDRGQSEDEDMGKRGAGRESWIMVLGGRSRPDKDDVAAICYLVVLGW